MISWRSAPLKLVAQIGYGARGLVYLLVAGLTVLAVLDAGGRIVGSKGALRAVLREPLGWVWLSLIGLGLLCFASWSLLQAFRSTSRSLASRAIRLSSAIAYGGLAAFSIDLATGWAGHTDGDGFKGWTYWLMSQPFGPWLVAVLGLVVALGGFVFYWQAWHAVIEDYVAGSEARWWAGPLGRIGFTAKGMVFNLIGGFLFLAGLHANPQEAAGLGDALSRLENQAYGWALLAVTAIGLGAYGVFSLTQAFYRPLNV